LEIDSEGDELSLDEIDADCGDEDLESDFDDDGDIIGIFD